MIKNITVLGSGIMGHAIAGHFATHGYSVVMYDAFAEALPKAMEAMRKELELFEEEGMIAAGSIDEILARVTPAEDLEQALKDADYVIEAAPERMELKQQLFADMERYGKPTAIFASNTSSLPLAGMTQKAARRSWTKRWKKT